MSNPPSLAIDDLRATLPPLYTTEEDSDPLVLAKFFTPWAGWTWFVTEFDGEDLFFGLVVGHEVELGYFRLSELVSLRGPGGIGVERDVHFTRRPLSQVRAELARQHGGSDGHEVHEGSSREFNARVTEPQRPPSALETPAIKLLETRLDASDGLTRMGASAANPQQAAAVLSDLIGKSDREHFVALLLNAKYQITHAHVVSRGTTQSTLVHPREVFKAAVLSNAAALIVGHNHPSGDLQPSVEDRDVERRLKQAGKLMGIAVLDSLIVEPGNKYFASSTGCVAELSRSRQPVSSQVSAGNLEEACQGLMQDIDEVLARQGEAWWKETVSSGSEHRDQAKRILDAKRREESSSSLRGPQVL